MKRTLSILFCLCGLAAVAGRVTVAWSPSPSTNVTYRLYAATAPEQLAETNLSSAAVRVDVGTNLSAAIQFTNAGTWHLVATARRDGVESEPSNMLTLLVPESPSSLGAVAVEATFDLSATNGGFHDIGAFRLRLIRPPQ